MQDDGSPAVFLDVLCRRTTHAHNGMSTHASAFRPSALPRPIIFSPPGGHGGVLLSKSYFAVYIAVVRGDNLAIFFQLAPGRC